MTKKHKGLGIGALLSTMNTNINPEEKQEMVQELSASILYIPIIQIEENPYNPRKEFEAEALQELAESIQLHGLIQPVTVRLLSENRYQLISGERRWRASKMAGLTEIPAYIRLTDDDAMLELALIENIQRQDLNALEIANTYQRLMEELKLTHEMLSKRVGKKRSTVSNYLRLLKLPASIQNSIKEDRISMGHARALLSLEDLTIIEKISMRILDYGISVRQVEQLVKMISGSLPEIQDAVSKGKITLEHAVLIYNLKDIVKQLSTFKEVIKRDLSPEQTEKWIQQQWDNPTETIKKTTAGSKNKESWAHQKIASDLSSKWSTKVQIQSNADGKGVIMIPFDDTEDLNRILDHF